MKLEIKNKEYVFNGDVLKINGILYIYRELHLIALQGGGQTSFTGMIKNLQVLNSSNGSIKLSVGSKVTVSSTTGFVERILRNPKITIEE